MKKILKIIISIYQILVIITIRTVYFRKVKVKSYKAKFPSRPFVIAANHQTSLDPLIITCFMPLKNTLRSLPYGFITHNKYYHRWWKPFLFIGGCYPSHPNHPNQSEHKYGIGASIKYINDGYNVVIFPEGKRTKEKLPAKHGVSKILEQTDANLILCKIKWSKSKIFLTFQVPDNQIDRSDPQAIIDAIYNID